MASTMTISPIDMIKMLKHMVHSMDLEVRGAEFVGEDEQEKIAIGCIRRFSEFVNTRCRRLPSEGTISADAPETLPPRYRDAWCLRKMAECAADFSLLVEKSSKPMYFLKETEMYRALQDEITHLIEDEIVVPHPRNAASTKTNCAVREYKSPHGLRLSKLGELCKTLADTVEDNNGNTYKIRQMDERAKVGLLLDLLVDSDVLPLKSARKLDGISLSQLQGLMSAPVITLNTPKITIKASGEIVTGGIDVAG